MVARHRRRRYRRDNATVTIRKTATSEAVATVTFTLTVAATPKKSVVTRHIRNSTSGTRRHDDDRESAVGFVATDRGDSQPDRRAPATGLLLCAAAATHSRRTHENVE